MIRGLGDISQKTEVQLLQFSQLLQQNAILLATALMNEGETEMVVCFDNFGNMSQSINYWRNDGSPGLHDANEENPNPNLTFKKQTTDGDLISIHTQDLKNNSSLDSVLPSNNSNSSLDHSPLSSAKSTVSVPKKINFAPVTDASKVTLRKRRNRRKRNPECSDDNYQFSSPESARKYCNENSVKSSPRESMPTRSSVRLFFDPRDTNSIAKEADIDIGSLFQDMVDGKPESVRDKLKLLSPESRFLLIFRLQRAAQNFVVTLDECK